MNVSKMAKKHNHFNEIHHIENNPIYENQTYPQTKIPYNFHFIDQNGMT